MRNFKVVVRHIPRAQNDLTNRLVNGVSLSFQVFKGDNLSDL